MMKTVFLLIAGLIMLSAPAQAEPYDPTTRIYKVVTIDTVITDSARQREIPLRLYVPQHHKQSPVILFSHGLGGSKNNNAYLGQHWAARGYIAAFMQHAGSDEAVWKDAKLIERRKKLLRAADANNLLLRLGDVSAVIDQLEAWNTHQGHGLKGHDLKSHPLKGRLDLEHIGMSGHSFGAVTTQGVSGQQFPGKSFTDTRIDAALMFSPSPPRNNKDKAATAFSTVSIPWFLMTGTEDGSPLGIDIDPADRLSVFPALPVGDKYQVVFFAAEHSAFGDTERRLKKKQNPNHHKAILALSIAFWDAYLGGNEEAKRWLQDGGGASVLEAQDVWQVK